MTAKTALTRITRLTIVKAISKMHLTINNCVTPRSGIHAISNYTKVYQKPA
jgi:hypothetical protein